MTSGPCKRRGEDGLLRGWYWQMPARAWGGKRPESLVHRPPNRGRYTGLDVLWYFPGVRGAQDSILLLNPYQTRMLLDSSLSLARFGNGRVKRCWSCGWVGRR